MSLIQKALRTKIKVKKLSRLQKVQKTKVHTFPLSILSQTNLCNLLQKSLNLQIFNLGIFIFQVQKFAAFPHARIFSVTNSNWVIEMASCKLLSYMKLRLKKKTSLEKHSCHQKSFKSALFSEKFNEKYEHVHRKTFTKLRTSLHVQ